MYKKVNSAGTEKKLLRLLPVFGHGARVLPPGASTEICARAPTKCYVQTAARARALCPGTKLKRGLSLQSVKFGVWCVKRVSPRKGAHLIGPRDRSQVWHVRSHLVLLECPAEQELFFAFYRRVRGTSHLFTKRHENRS